MSSDSDAPGTGAPPSPPRPAHPPAIPPTDPAALPPADPADGPSADPVQHQQPRWAWWVIGIAIPLLSIAVTLSLTGHDPSASPESKPSATQPAQRQDTTAAPSTSDSPSEAASSETPPKVRFGPEAVEFPNITLKALDLDSVPPLQVDEGAGGSDVWVTQMSEGPPHLGTPDSASTLAPLPPSGPAPSEADCADQSQKDGAYDVVLTRGARYCGLTRDGRTFYLRTVSAPASGTIRIELTVWELPS